MKTVIEMAREAGNNDLFDAMQVEFFERFAELVRADERARTVDQPAQQEPEYIQLRHKEDDGFSPWGTPLDPKHRHNEWASGVEMRLLFTAPQSQPSQREPLTVAEIMALWTQEVKQKHSTTDLVVAFTRAIEAGRNKANRCNPDFLKQQGGEEWQST